MATLSASQLLSLRKKIGDHDPTTADEYDLSDPEIQAVYDNNNSDEIDTIVELLETRLAMWINTTDAISDTGGSTIKSQKVKHIRSLLDYYNKKAGSGLFTIGSDSSSVATFNLNLDYEDENT